MELFALLVSPVWATASNASGLKMLVTVARRFLGVEKALWSCEIDFGGL